MYPRLIVCLDIADGRVVKGRKFRELRDIGDPVELGRRYCDQGVDEIVCLDIASSVENRAPFVPVIEKVARVVNVPLTVGGGVRTIDDIQRYLRAGADKVTLNSTLLQRPEILSEAAEMVGSQAVVAALDVATDGALATKSASVASSVSAVDFARRAEVLGAGEIVLTSIGRDGTRKGYDLPLLRAVAAAVTVPVVASGGAGEVAHLAQALAAGANAVLVAGLLHDGITTALEIKRLLQGEGVRMTGIT